MTDIKNSALYYLSKINGNRGRQVEVMNGLVKAMSFDERFPKPIKRIPDFAALKNEENHFNYEKPHDSKNLKHLGKQKH